MVEKQGERLADFQTKGLLTFQMDEPFSKVLQ